MPERNQHKNSRRQRMAENRRDGTHAHSFERLPREVAEALRRGDLSFRQHGLLTYIIGSIDWSRGDYARTLAAFAADVDFPESDETLRTDLKALKDGGWIAFESKQGQRSAYHFRLGPRIPKSIELPEDFQKMTPSNLEVTSKHGGNSNGATPHHEGDSASSRLPSTSLAIDRDANGDKDGDQTHPIASERGGSDEEWLASEARRVASSQ
jgi:hypothetical protein